MHPPATRLGFLTQPLPLTNCSWSQVWPVVDEKSSGLIQEALLLTQPAIAGQGALHVKAVGLPAIEDGTKAQLEHQQGMLQQKAPQVDAVKAGARGKALITLE
jgi:hypothetical protein